MLSSIAHSNLYTRPSGCLYSSSIPKASGEQITGWGYPSEVKAQEEASSRLQDMGKRLREGKKPNCTISQAEWNKVKNNQ